MQTLSQYYRYSPLETNEKQIVEERTTSQLNKEVRNFSLPSDKIYVGLEVEVEGLSREFDFSSTCWRVKPDGSLRNEGAEFVSYPIRGKNLIYAVLMLNEFLNGSFPNHAFSERTSVHVHLNIRNLTFEEVIKLIIIYTIVEPLMFSYVKKVSVDRYNNIFCIPIKDFFEPTIIYKKSLEQLLTSFDINLPRNWSKYSGMNLIPIRDYGSVEFRQLGGTSNPTTIINWVSLILKLKQAAMKIPFSELKDLVLDLNTRSHYRHFLDSVFENYVYLFELEEIQSFLEKGVSLNKLLFIKEPYFEKINDINALVESPMYYLLKKYKYIVEKTNNEF